jgi:hypothetical protein
MKKNIYLLVAILSCYGAIAQQRYNFKPEHIKGQDVVCPASFVDRPSFVDTHPELKQKMQNKNAKISANQGATFIVKYVGFPNDAKAAFQRAVDIWAAALNSTVPIRVTAYWEDLGTNVLGAANTNDYYRNFIGAKEVNTFYPLALAEKLAGKDLNSINEDDIFCRFNSKIPWYYGTSENIPFGTFDFTSIVLHELGHGLGFVGSMRVSGTQGFYGFGTTLHTIYDKYLETGTTGKALIDTATYKNPSNLLKSALTSEDIFFVSPRTATTDKSKKVVIYAPNPWEDGSSISHLDDATYGTGGINSLMTPTASLREKNLEPGPIALNMFYDMGWKGTSIAHTPIKDFKAVSSVTIEAKVITDTTFNSDKIKLVYVLNGLSAAKAVEVKMTPKTAGSNIYVANITIPAGTGLVQYYITADDNYGFTVTSPANGGLTTGKLYWEFEIGKTDVFGPVIEHYQPEILPSTSPVSLLANVVDDYQEGIDTVYVNYFVNGVQKAPIGLKKYNILTDNILFTQGSADERAYLGENIIKDLKSGDIVKYQIIATDKSGNKTTIPTIYAGLNQNDKPVDTFYEFTVTDIVATPVNDYSTDFENASADFATIGFSVNQPANFSSKGLHTSHPYTNGLGLLDPVSGNPYLSFDKSEIAMLKVPIVLKSTGATITYDEVVLVEPGDAGSTYGSTGFYDYVVVEGSFDGSFWFPLQDGYDSRIDASFQKTYEGSFSSGTAPNSTAVGTQSMVKKRSLNIYGGGDLTTADAGQTMLLRFRLHSDQWTAGWGWSIDNLYVQKSAPVITANEPVNIRGLQIYPNPSSNYLDVNFEVSKPQTIKMEIFSLTGTTMYSENIPVVETTLQHRINLGNFTTGTYFIKIKESTGEVVKRFVVNN